MSNTIGEIFKDKKGEARGRVKGANGKILATTEGYKNKVSAENALKLLGVLKKNTKDLSK
jgi:uncharacterized protein YegP (UPF0339 family)